MRLLTGMANNNFIDVSENDVYYFKDDDAFKFYIDRAEVIRERRAGIVPLYWVIIEAINLGLVIGGHGWIWLNFIAYYCFVMGLV